MIYHNADFYAEKSEDINEAISDTYEAILELPETGHYRIMVVDVEPVRNLGQNKYYWLILQIIENYTGHSRYELHRIFARMFNMKIAETTTREIIIVGGSTTEIKEKAFSEYCKQIRHFTLEFMGIDQDMWDQALPPQDGITEELLWQVGIYQ